MHDYDKLLRAALMTVHRYARGGYAGQGFVDDAPDSVLMQERQPITPSSLAKAWTPPEEAIAQNVGPRAGEFMQQYPEKLGAAMAAAPEAIAHHVADTVMYPGQVLYGERPYDRDEAIKWANDAAGFAMTGGLGGATAKAGETVLGSGPVRTHNGVNWNFFEDARKLNKNDFLNKYAIEPNNPAHASHADLLKIAEKQKNLPAHYEYNPKALDPFEMESWEEALSPKSAKQVQEVQSVIQKNEPLPPILVEGSPYDTKYRPMVLDGHHRTIAALNENASSIPVFFTNKTLNEIWSHLNKINEKAAGGTIPFGPEAAQDAVRIAKQQAGRR
jgi:hypothetical protein